MSGGSGEGAEPDLTPMLDMVFQLITFFMLVMTLRSFAIDTELKLPVVGSARPVDTKGKEELLIVNVAEDGAVRAYGIKKEPKAYIASEAQVSRIAARNRGMDIKPGDELPTRVVIRCDEATPFKLLYNIIKECQDQGFVSFALRSTQK